MGVGVDKNALEVSCRDLLLERATFTDVKVFLPELGFSMIPANGDMTEAEIRLREMPVGDFALKSALAEVQADYDYILLDCPPALSKMRHRANPIEALVEMAKSTAKERELVD